MPLLRAPRLLLAFACLAAALTGGLIAAERSSASMACRDVISGQPVARTTPESDVRVRIGRADALALHPDRRLPPEGSDAQGNERSPAGARPRAPEGRIEPARLPDRDSNHGPRNPAGADRAERAGEGRGAESMVRDPGATSCRYSGRPQRLRRGAGASRASRLAAIHDRQWHAGGQARPSSSDPTPRRYGKDRRKG
jgi:hypothetical protein